MILDTFECMANVDSFITESDDDCDEEVEQDFQMKQEFRDDRLVDHVDDHILHHDNSCLSKEKQMFFRNWNDVEILHEDC